MKILDQLKKNKMSEPKHKIVHKIILNAKYYVFKENTIV